MGVPLHSSTYVSVKRILNFRFVVEQRLNTTVPSINLYMEFPQIIQPGISLFYIHRWRMLLQEEVQGKSMKETFHQFNTSYLIRSL